MRINVAWCPATTLRVEQDIGHCMKAADGGEPVWSLMALDYIQDLDNINRLAGG